MPKRLFTALILSFSAFPASFAYGQSSSEIVNADRVSCDVAEGRVMTIALDGKVIFQRPYADDPMNDPVMHLMQVCRMSLDSANDYPETKLRIDRARGMVIPANGQLKFNPSEWHCFKQGMFQRYIGIVIGVGDWPIVAPYGYLPSMHKMYSAFKLEDVLLADKEVDACNAVLDEARHLNGPIIINPQLDGISVPGSGKSYEVPLPNETKL